MNITITKIESSLIKGVDYNKGILTIDVGKKLYSYRDVPRSVFIDFIGSNSLGKFFNDFIKDIYEYVELN